MCLFEIFCPPCLFFVPASLNPCLITPSCKRKITNWRSIRRIIIITELLEHRSSVNDRWSVWFARWLHSAICWSRRRIWFLESRDVVFVVCIGRLRGRIEFKLGGSHPHVNQSRWEPIDEDMSRVSRVRLSGRLCSMCCWSRMQYYTVN